MRTATDATFGEVRGLLTAEPSTPLRPNPPPRASKSLSQYLADRGGVLARVGRRMGPISVSTVFVVLGLLYCFRWGSVVQHIPSLWLFPGDLWGTYVSASDAAHGHLGSIYGSGFALQGPPGILVVLAPLGALSGGLHTLFLQILTTNHQLPAYPQVHVAPALVGGRPAYLTNVGYFVVHPQWLLLVLPYALILSCIALFAFDALAERLQVSQPRRTVLCIAEAVLLWNMTVIWGHPEDAIAVALAVYAVVFILDGRFVGAGWLFGAAVAMQPLVLLMLPVLLAMAGRQRILGLVIRSALPSVVLTAPPLIANFHATYRALVDQPYLLILDHQTPWTALAPRLGGHGSTLVVAGGPARLLAIVIAVGLGFWVARYWRERPELVAVACVVALALRCYTESVLVAYYPWAALAVGLVVAARCSHWRFGVAVALAVATTAAGQQQLSWFTWWAAQMVGLTGLLIVAAQPKPVALPTPTPKPAVARTATRGGAGLVQERRPRGRLPHPRPSAQVVANITVRSVPHGNAHIDDPGLRPQGLVPHSVMPIGTCCYLYRP